MRTWTKHDPVKNYFPLPNEIYQLGLSHGAIAVYGYLLRIEDRRTYQCHPSYATIGKAVGMSNNTVRKYVQELEERGLIVTERTSIITRDGRTLKDLYDERVVLFEKYADITVSEDGLELEETIENVMEILENQ